MGVGRRISDREKGGRRFAFGKTAPKVAAALSLKEE
jgi:hypothetical protein